VLQSRILALDLGKRRIGLAVSDLLGLTAQGLTTLERRNRQSDLAELKRLVKEYDVGMILVGQPLHMDGRAGTQAENAQDFAAGLHRHLGLPVEMWDERLTTAEAQRVLKMSGVSLNKRRQAVDQMAAVILLQSYLDKVAHNA
jgi:putative Holliday junction resolvase